jgi:hypothetical protein
MTYGATEAAARNVAHMLISRTRAAAVLAMAALGAAGCGGDDSGDSLAEAERLAQAKQEGAREARAEQEARKSAREQRRLRRELQRVRRERAQANAPSGGNGATPSSTAIPSSSSTDCGSGVTAGANTSCAFARNVRDQYFQVGGGSVTIDVYSPTTGRYYSMYCREGVGGAATLCTGGNNASVSFF